jgi:hypothetical protein
MAGECSAHIEMASGYNILVGKSEGESPLGRPGRRWEDNIKMNIREIWFRICGLDSSG